MQYMCMACAPPGRQPVTHAGTAHRAISSQAAGCALSSFLAYRGRRACGVACLPLCLSRALTLAKVALEPSGLAGYSDLFPAIGVSSPHCLKPRWGLCQGSCYLWVLLGLEGARPAACSAKFRRGVYSACHVNPKDPSFPAFGSDFASSLQSFKDFF